MTLAMNAFHVVILAFVQGLTELLPVSSSAHVIIMAKLLHENMSTPANAFLLVLLHTGTMLAVILYFWRKWVDEFFSSWERFYTFFKLVVVSTFLSAVVFLPVRKLVVHVLSHGSYHADIEVLFNKLSWIAPALAVVGILIIFAGLHEARTRQTSGSSNSRGITWMNAIVMGILQGFAIPFRGFSRSGCTISGGLLTGGDRSEIESYSFAMVVVITPAAIAWEAMRAFHAAHASGVSFASMLALGLLGLCFAFLAGLLALAWLSRWLEQGRWHWFGVYCLFAASVAFWLSFKGW